MMGRIRLTRLILISFFSLLVIQILIVGIFGKFSALEFRQREKESVDYILSMYSRNMEGALEKTDNDLEDILLSNSTLMLLKNKSGLQRWHASYALSELLNKKLSSTMEADAYVVFDAEYEKFIMARSNNILYDDLEPIQNYLSGIAGLKKKNTGWISAQMGEKVYLIKCYYYGGVCISAIISEQKIREILSDGQNTENLLEFYVTDAEGNVTCASNPDVKCGQRLETEMEEKYFRPRWYRQEVMNGTCYVVAVVRQSDALRDSPYFFIVLVMLLISLIFIFWLMRFMNDEVIKPINVLADTSGKIRMGDLTIRPEYSCKNTEMAGLRETYVTMLDTLMELKLQEYENVIRVKESELKYMHMQLKPHFFLNALSTINSMAYENENDEIHEFIQAFSRNIRYMFRVGLHTVSLKEEIANIEDYLEMQRILYKDCFYFYMEVPEMLEKWEIPQMLLHTFMENIFKHAVSIDTFTTIFLRCSLEKFDGISVLKIEIQNSGNHFRQEILERINEDAGKKENHNRGIGLIYTKEILSIMYDREDLLFLENEEAGNVKVTVRIPGKVQMKGKGYSAE